MKTLKEYFIDCLYESDSSSSATQYMLTFDGIDGGSAMLDSIKSICQTNVPNVNYISGNNTDIKIGVNKDNLVTINKIIDKVNEFIENIPNDKHDNIGAQLDKLTSQVEAIQDAVDAIENETDTEEPETKSDDDKTNDSSDNEGE